jgi:xylulokinase
MKYLVGIDIGTSGTKVALFDFSGNPLCSHTAGYRLYQPHNGWAEQDPEDWWQAVCEGLRAVCHTADPAEIAGVGFSGQMHGLVMLGSDMRALRKSIIWCDQRSGRECGEITAAVGAEQLMRITKSPALTGFTASKLLWVRNNEPDTYERCHKVLLPKDYIRFRLTGELYMDVSDASGTQMLDIEKRAWSDYVLTKLEIDPSWLPPTCESFELAGKVTPGAAAETGLRSGTLVAAGAGDNAATAVGCGVIYRGRAFTSLGTSGVVFAHTDGPVWDTKGRIHNFCAATGGWHVLGSVQATGLSYTWFCDNFCQPEAELAKATGRSVWSILDELATTSPKGANRLIYLPYLMGERTPHLDPDLRGAFLGLSAIHTKADLLRALAEGVTYGLADCLSVLRELKITTESMIACGGGAASPFRRQMLADVFGIPVSTIKSEQGAVLGAALLAGVASGVYGSVEEACSIIQIESQNLPDPAAHAEYMKYYEIYRAAYPVLKELYKRLTHIS